MKNTTKIRVLQTSDIHGYVTPYHYSTMADEPLGIAKISTLVKKLKHENTLLIDTGDIIQGSPLMHYHSKHQKDQANPMATIINHMGYDVVTIGNHEFNYGIDYLKGYVDHLKPELLLSNILNSTTSEPLFGKPYSIKDINGIKVGIIGLTTHYIPNWENPKNIKNITFKDAYETCRIYVSKLKPLVDIIIVNYHGGFESNLETGHLEVKDTGENQGYKMLSEIEGIDVLLTGHQHQVIAGESHGTLYTQPGNNGKYLGVIDLEVDNQTKHILSKNARLETVNDIQPDKEIMELIDQTETKTQAFLDVEIGHLDSPLLITNQLEARLHKHKVVSFINQVQMEITGAPISSCSLGNDVSGFNQSITIRDIIGTYIYPNTLVVKSVSGTILKKALEKSASFFEMDGDNIVIAKKYQSPKLELYAYDMYDGIEYTIDIRKPIGDRVTALTYQNMPIKDDQNVEIVMNNYRASGGGGYEFMQDSPVVKDPQIEVIDALIRYIEKHPKLTINHNDNITILPK